jgi:hypothetical protein
VVHVPAVVIAVPLLAFSLYRRVRRNVGRQKFQPWRLWMRSGFLTLALIALLFWPAFETPMALALCGGAAAGLALSRWGVVLTRFEQQPDGLYYKPNTLLGIAISLIFMARMAYRFVVLYPAIQAASAQGVGFSPQHFVAGTRSPLTLALLGLVLGYFVGYCLGLLWRARQQQCACETPLPEGLQP